MSVYTQRTISCNNLPVVRQGRTLLPMTMNVININRSEVIRQLFHRMGDVSNSFVLDYLLSQGIRVSATLIEQQRKQLLRRGLLGNKS